MRKTQNTLLIIIVLIATQAKAQLWTGAVSTEWENPANWAAGTPVIIPANAPRWPVLNGNIVVNGLDMQPGSSINLNGYTLQVLVTEGNPGNISGATITGGGAIDMRGAGIKSLDGNTFNGNFIVQAEVNSYSFREAATAPNIYNGDISFNFSGAGEAAICYQYASAFHGKLAVTRNAPGLTTLFRQGFAAIDGDFSYTAPDHRGETHINANNLYLPAIAGKVDISCAGTRFTSRFSMKGIKNKTPGGSVKITALGHYEGGRVVLTSDTLLVDSVALRDFDDVELTYNVINGVLYARHFDSGARLAIMGNTIYGITKVDAAGENYTFADQWNIFYGDVEINVGGITNNDICGHSNTYHGNLTINSTMDGKAYIFVGKFLALKGNFTFNNTGDVEAIINFGKHEMPAVGGDININFNADGNVNSGIAMYGMSNSGGGRIAVFNTRYFNFENNNLKLDSVVARGFGTNNTTSSFRFSNNTFTGHIHFAGPIASAWPLVIGGNTVNGNTKVEMFDDATLLDGGNIHNGDVEYNFTSTNVTIPDGRISYIGMDRPPVYRGNLTINKKNAGSLQIFNMGLEALDGNFTVNSEGGGDILINKDALPTATIGGKINIRQISAVPGRSFTLTRIKNAQPGGSILIENSQVALMFDTLLVNNITVRDANSTGDDNGIMRSKISGDVHFEDAAANKGNIYFYDNTFDGNTVVKLNSSANFFQGFFSNDVFNGDATFERNGSGNMSLAYLAPAHFNRNLFLKSSAGISFTDVVSFGGNDHADFEQFGTQSVIIPKLHINKPAGITLAIWDTITISNNVHFESGIINAIFNPLRFGSNTTHTGASATSHVIGKVLKEGGNAFTFPLGNYSTLNSVSMTAPASVNHLFSAEYFQRNPNLDGYNTKQFEQTGPHPVQRVSGCEYWDVRRIEGSSNVALTFSFNQQACASATGSYITDPSKARIVHWNGSMWQDLGNGGYSGNTAGTIATAAPVTSFSPFTLASTDPLVNPLPLNLLSFHALKKDDAVQLKWVTDNEVNVKHYEVERAGADHVFKTIAIVAANNSANRNNYSSTDQSPLQGINYYRLRMVDIDGSFKYSKTVYLSFSAAEALEVWPNPVASGSNVKLTLPRNINSANLELLNSQGRMVRRWQNFNSGTGGTLHVSDLPAGIYILRINFENEVQAVKLVIH